ncbi:MAG: ankyrin repeat domain-containing protein [Luteolibacter sp.]
MSRLSYRVLALSCLLGVTCGLVTGCKSPRERGLQKLSQRGIEPSERSLIDAASRGDEQIAGWLLDAGVPTEGRDAKGKTALRIAVENSREGLVDLLIAYRADLDATMPDQVSVLSSAAENASPEIFGKLLRAGAAARGRTSAGEELLPWAIREGRLSYARVLLEKGADPHTRDAAGNSSLYLALKFGHRDIAESLLSAGVHPGEASPQNVLFLAIHHGWYDFLPSLIRQGADPNEACFEEFTPLEYAVVTANRLLLHALLEAGADVHHVAGTSGKTAFRRVIESGNDLILRDLKERNIDVSAVNWERELWSSIRQGNRPMAQLVLRQGVHGTLRDENGRLPVEAVAGDRNGDFVKLLMDYGCPPGRALVRAAERGDRPMAGLLVACGAPLDGAVVPPWMDSPLSAAIRSHRDDLALDLLNLGATWETTPDGESIFHLAIACGCPQTVRELLRRGAEPNKPLATPASDSLLRAVPRGDLRWALRNDSNITPLMLAAHVGNLDTARHLLRGGAKLNARTRKLNLWPITIAAKRRDIPMSRLFLGKDPFREQRRIVIRLSEQKARMYDADGNEIFVTAVSTGRKGFVTPTGIYVITNKNREWTSTLYQASMPFFQRLSCSDFGLHQGVVPGYPASHGCIRVPAGKAAKLFAMTDTGDRVHIEP